MEAVKFARILIVVFPLVLGAPLARAETVYYAVAEGENYEKETWHTQDLKSFNANRPGDVFDLFMFDRFPDGTSKVAREYSTPSGDWLFLLIYHYDKNGRLTKLDYEFRTFNGIDAQHGDEGLTRCVRSYSLTDTGKLIKTSDEIIDMESGRKVTRSVYEPKVKHWMCLGDLPIQPKS